ncbi:hypothetical protein ACQ4LE_003048, partial [Meloidogyne hapla]
MRCLFAKYSLINYSNILLQQRLFCDFVLHRGASNIVFSPSCFLQISKNVNKLQSRGIRNKSKGFGSSTSSDDKSSDKKEDKKEDNGDKYKQFVEDKQKFKEEFHKKFKEFVQEYGKDIDKNPSKAKFMNEATLEFIKKFNEKSEGSGFSIEKDESTVKNFFILNLVFAAFSAFMLAVLFSGEGLAKEHAQLLNSESTINFDQFVRDYLNAGEVDGIYYYPNKNFAFAMLHPNAVINGKTVTSAGVPISTSDRLDFNFSPMQFIHAVRDAEHQLGVDQRESVPILIKKTMSTGRKIVYVLLFGLISAALFNYYRSIMGKSVFRVISSAA